MRTGPRLAGGRKLDALAARVAEVGKVTVACDIRNEHDVVAVVAAEYASAPRDLRPHAAAHAQFDRFRDDLLQRARRVSGQGVGQSALIVRIIAAQFDR